MSSPQQEHRLGKYIVGEELGRGGFATVYRAHDTVLRRDVALKLLHPPLLTDPAFVTRFENDARATAQLDHPRIAAIYELGHHEGRMFMAIQLLAGGSLADRVKAQGRLSFFEAVRVVEDLAQAIDYAHTAGFTHRDVKPGNILFNKRGDAILTDFGLVKAAESSVIARTTMGGLIGTPAYMAPEIWEGQNEGPGADVYALGCVLFEMLSGELLFTGATPPAVMLAHFQPHRYPAHWPDGTPVGIEAVLERALARDPAARYATAGALAADLRALAAPPAVPAQQLVKVQQSTSVAAPSLGQPEPAQPAAAHTPGAAQPADTGSPEVARASQGKPRTWRPTLVVSAAWLAGWIASLWLAWILEGDGGSAGTSLLAGWAAGWAGAGLFAGLMLRRGAPIKRKWPTLKLAIGWPLCLSIALILAAIVYSSQPERGIDALALGTALAAGIAGITLRGHDRAFTWGRIALLALGWGSGWRLAEVLNNDGSGGGPWHGLLYTLSYGYGLHEAFAKFPQLVPVYLIYGGILGAALGGALIWLFGKLQDLMSNRA